MGRKPVEMINGRHHKLKSRYRKGTQPESIRTVNWGLATINWDWKEGPRTMIALGGEEESWIEPEGRRLQ